MTDAIQPETTLKDIAAEAEVSVAAVSKVLNNRKGVSDATRKRVLSAAEGLGYRGRAARQLGKASIVTLENYVSNDLFYGDILSSISASGQDHGLEIGMSVFRNVDEMMAPDNLPTQTQAQGVLLVGADHIELIEHFAETGIPAVIINGMDRTMRLSSISPDYHYGAWRATTHLLDSGHHDIIHVTHPYRESVRRRIDGFRNAMEERGIGFDPSRHILDLGNPQNMSLAAGDILDSWLNAGNKMPTAFFCVSDMVALGIMQALDKRAIKVPDEVSVVGFDGLAVSAHTSPPLTSMQSDRAALGRIGVQLLANHMSDPAALVQRITVGVDLVLRSSTAGPVMS